MKSKATGQDPLSSSPFAAANSGKNTKNDGGLSGRSAQGEPVGRGGEGEGEGEGEKGENAWGRKVSAASSMATGPLSAGPSVDLDLPSTACFLSDGEPDALSSSNSPTGRAFGSGGSLKKGVSGPGGVYAATGAGSR